MGLEIGFSPVKLGQTESKTQSKPINKTAEPVQQKQLEENKKVTSQEEIRRLEREVLERINEYEKNLEENKEFVNKLQAEELVNIFFKSFNNSEAIFDNIEDKPKFISEKEGKYSCFNVAIIDDYGSVIPEFLNLSHGAFVEKYASTIIKGAKFEQKKILIQTKNGMQDFSNIIFQLNNILKEIETGKKYDAINMSIYFLDAINIEDLKIETDGKEIQITNQNINQYRDKLKEVYLKKFTENKKAFKKSSPLGFLISNRDITDIIKNAEEISRLIKKISDKGVKIFLINNNECGTKLCYSDLIDLDPDYENCNNPNIITVSANDCEERSTPLSDIKEKSTYTVNFFEDGLDITEDGIIDIIDKKQLAKKLCFPKKLEGNSFAAPTALAKYLKELHDKKEKK